MVKPGIFYAVFVLAICSKIWLFLVIWPVVNSRGFVREYKVPGFAPGTIPGTDEC